jgi:hypothetical protein
LRIAIVAGPFGEECSRPKIVQPVSGAALASARALVCNAYQGSNAAPLSSAATLTRVCGPAMPRSRGVMGHSLMLRHVIGREGQDEISGFEVLLVARKMAASTTILTGAIVRISYAVGL